METKSSTPKSPQRMTVTLAIALFSLSVVVLLVSSGLQLYSSFLTQQIAITSKQELIAQGASSTVRSYIDQHFSALETAADLTELVSLSGSKKKIVLDSLLGLKPDFRQLVILNAQDRQLADATRLSQISSGKILDQLSEDVLTQIHQGQRYISPIYIDDATSEPLIVMALPITDIFGDFQGTLAVEVNLKFMWDLVDQLQVGETGYAYVVDNIGNLIAFSDTGRVLRGENVKHILEVSEFVENTTQVGDVTPDAESYTGLLGTTVVGTYAPLGTPQWAVVTELPSNEAYQEVIGQGIRALIITIGIALLAGLVGFFIASRLSAPLIELSNIAAEVAGGNLSIEAKVAGPAEITQVASAFNEMTSRLHEMVTGLEQRVTARTRDLAIVAEVGTATATILESKKLLQEVVDLTKNRFELYHSHIYLLDETGENLVLTAGAGEPGHIMTAKGHSIPLDREQSLVARAARERRGVTVNDVTQAPDFLPNPLLPDTRSELAVPMIVGGNVIGVFDIQSEKVGRFTDSDVSIQTTMAAQLATSIQNVRSFEQSRKQAELETLVNSIGQKIQRAVTIEDTLQTAIRELGIAVSASRVKASIRQIDGVNETGGHGMSPAIMAETDDKLGI